jgi:type II restriction/modification system DNA methylase subunit YeeA
VIGKVVKSEDIPAATQLFTPNWIVKYLVQNSIGRQWMMTYPESSLKTQMEYYIAPAEQEASVTAALAAITPTSIEPETIKVLDPACGSGHILVEAYDILKAIYEERGYRSRDIPKLILEKNLYGLDIDDRAAQLAGFALMMKAREDDRRIFTRDIKLNVLAIQSTQHLDLPDLWRKLALNNDAKRGSMESIFDDTQNSLVDSVDDIDFKQFQSILALFEQAKTFGSLIQVPHEQANYLQSLTSQLTELAKQGDTMQKPTAMNLLPLVEQAHILAMKFDAVIANPPYMGGKGMNPVLKEFAKKHFPDSKSDLFSMFIERGFDWCKESGFNAQVTMQSWMFLSSYEAMREKLLSQKTLNTMAHLGARAFSEISGEVVQTTAFVFHGDYFSGYKPAFFRLVDGNEEQKKTALLSGKNRFDKTVQDDFKKISGSPVAYWASTQTIKAFSNPNLESYGLVRQGASTSDNDRFLRLWFEINTKKIGFRINDTNDAKLSSFKWFPYNKGGAFRKWYGNQDFVINYENDAKELKEFQSTLNQGWTARLKSREYYFKPAVSWPKISSGIFSSRIYPQGFIFDVAGCCYFPNDGLSQEMTVAYLNSSVVMMFLNFLSPTLNFELEQIKSLPFIKLDLNKFNYIDDIFLLAKTDWNNYETSWDFTENPLIRQKQPTLKAAFERWETQNRAAIIEMKRLEEENNRLFIDAYGLQDELTPDVPEEQITLVHADLEKDSTRLISYAIGCMMGRYSLDAEGLIYADAGNVDFDQTRYQTFAADDDGIIPLTDQDWFKDDATNRFRDFVRTVWGEDNLQENLAFVAESLCLGSLTAKRGEQSMETIRRYLSNQFYKDHLQTYKKRPIYWLFSSGKQKAFEGLVYLHRYNDSTLPRMRTEYVTPLLGKYDAFADQLKKQLEDATTSEATLLNKELLALEKKQTELRAFDDNLKHYADRRIKLDLDDGVKVNYGKFGDLLAEVKAVTGGKE